jgi:MFS family permease
VRLGVTIERQERTDAQVDGGSADRSPGRGLVVAVAFACLTVSAGFGFYSLSTYARFLVAHDGMSLTATSSGSTIYMLSSGLGGIAVARLLRRLDLRSVMLAGVVVSAATVPLVGLSRQAWQLWLVYLGYGLGAAGISMIPASTLVMRWFGEAPARAMALATTGMSVGGALVAPIVASWVARYGLPRAGWIMSVVTLALLAPFVLLAVPPAPLPARPEAVRSGPSGVGPGAQSAGPAGQSVAARAQVARVCPPQPVPAGRPRSRRLGFAAITLSFGLLMLSQVGAVTHMLTLGSERHIPNAATALSLLAGTSVVGRLVGIPVLPRVGVYRFCVFNGFLQAAAMITLGFARGSAGLFVGAILLGATVGNTVVLMPLVILDAFGRDGYPAAFARANFLTSFGVAVGPLLLGVLHDDLGGYTVGLGCLGAGSALAAVILTALFAARRRPRDPIPTDQVTRNP